MGQGAGTVNGEPRALWARTRQLPAGFILEIGFREASGEAIMVRHVQSTQMDGVGGREQVGVVSQNKGE